MSVTLMFAGQAAWHSLVLEQAPKPSSSIWATIRRTRSFRSAAPWGSSERWLTLAAVNRWAAAFLQLATHAPQPMQAAEFIAASATFFGTLTAFASGAEPTETETYPPTCWMRSKALRSHTRSRTTGNPLARHGSRISVSPSRNCRMRSWQVVVFGSGPWAVPLIITPQVPQMPSRQSWSKATGSRSSCTSCSLRQSSISRNDMSGLMSSTR